MSIYAARARAGQDRTSLYSEITDKIIGELEAGRVPLVQPWRTAAAKAPLAMPTNAATGRCYSGLNVLNCHPEDHPQRLPRYPLQQADPQPGQRPAREGRSFDRRAGRGHRTAHAPAGPRCPPNRSTQTTKRPACSRFPLAAVASGRLNCGSSRSAWPRLCRCPALSVSQAPTFRPTMIRWPRTSSVSPCIRSISSALFRPCATRALARRKLPRASSSPQPS